jgi:DNA polymerase-3 subunit epsilon
VSWPWARWLERRRHAGGEYGALFEPYQGEEWVALDLETTGLDPARDEILSLAAVPGEGRRLKLRDRLDLVVRSDSPRITQAIRHHRLRPDDVADGVPADQALAQLLAMVGNRPLVGYCIGFDIAMLDRILRPHLGFGLPNRTIDVQREYADWQRRIRPEGEPDLRFEAIATALDVPTPARHSALGDAVAAGLMHIRLGRR